MKEDFVRAAMLDWAEKIYDKCDVLIQDSYNGTISYSSEKMVSYAGYDVLGEYICKLDKGEIKLYCRTEKMMKDALPFFLIFIKKGEKCPEVSDASELEGFVRRTQDFLMAYSDVFLDRMILDNERINEFQKNAENFIEKISKK